MCYKSIHGTSLDKYVNDIILFMTIIYHDNGMILNVSMTERLLYLK